MSTVEDAEFGWVGLADSVEVQPEAPQTHVTALMGYFRDCALSTHRGIRLFDVFASQSAQVIDLAGGQFDDVCGDGLVLAGRSAADIAIAHEVNAEESELLVGALFVVGRHRGAARGASKGKICAPLLLGRASAVHDLTGATFLLESELTLNLSLLAELLDIDSENEDEVLLRLNHLLEVAPDVPLDPAEVDHFLTALSTGFDLPFEVGRFDALCEASLADLAAQPDGLSLMPCAAIFLGTQPAELSVVRELEALAIHGGEGTALEALLDPGRVSDGSGDNALVEGDREPLTPSDWHDDIEVIELTDPQRAAVASARSRPLTVITGPPGTGKTYTICALVIDHLLAGRTVLVTSGTREAVSNVAQELARFAGEFVCAHTGERSQQRALADRIGELTKPGFRPMAYSADELQAAHAQYVSLREELRNLEAQLLDVLARQGSLAFHDAAIQARADLAEQFDLDAISDREATRRRLDRAQVAPDAGWLRRAAGVRALKHARKSLGARNRDADVATMAAALAVADSLAEVDELTRVLATSPQTHQGFQALSELRTGLLRQGAIVLAMRRNTELAGLLAQPEKKRALATYAQALKVANKQKKKALLAEVTKGLLLEAFPCWAVKDSDLSQALPLGEAMFDLVVLDEASTVTLSDAAPAMFRGDRAVVVGDPQQLRFVSFISRSAETASFARHELPLVDQVRYRFSQRSLFDVAADAAPAQASFLLDEHFRCEPHIIAFSNREFYRGQLRIMTEQPHTAGASAIDVRYVAGRRQGSNTLAENAREIQEAILVAGEVVEAAERGAPVQTLALLSPLRGQTNGLSRAVAAAFTSDQIARHKIKTGTAHTLQGDQRDVVVISTVLDPDFAHQTLAFIEDPNLFNVAITRARKRLVLVTSVRPEDLPAGEKHLLARFLNHAANPHDPAANRDAFRSDFERQVADALRVRGLKVISAYPSCGYEIDLVVVGEGRSIAIECDGHPHHWNADGTYTDDDLARHAVLSRAGWDIARVPWSLWRERPHDVVEDLVARVSAPKQERPQPTTPQLPPPRPQASLNEAPQTMRTKAPSKKAPSTPRRAAAPAGPRVDADRSKCSCGGRWVKRRGRYGMFYGCSRYPRCRRTRPYR